VKERTAVVRQQQQQQQQQQLMLATRRRAMGSEEAVGLSFCVHLRDDDKAKALPSCRRLNARSRTTPKAHHLLLLLQLLPLRQQFSGEVFSWLAKF
jgi:hypothetical protein